MMNIIIKSLSFIFFFIFIFITSGQTVDSIPGLKLTDCTLNQISSDTVNIAGIYTPSNKYYITSFTKVQTVCYVVDGIWEYKHCNYEISIIYDTNCIFLDSMYSIISRYWDEKEEWAKRYNTGGDFSYLPNEKGFYKKDTFVPFISTVGDITGENERYELIWFEHRVYKIIMTGSEGGFGSIEDFISQNFNLNKGGNLYKLTIKESLLKKIRKILKDKVNCIK